MQNIQKNRYYIDGFTLVELSIVIVIIGLLIAGVAAGASLIKQTELNSYITERQTATVAISLFESQYKYLPGDFINAGAFWPSANCLNGIMPIGCNGNGNGAIDQGSANGSEPFRVWQHLSLANLINGSYMGTSNQQDQLKSQIPGGFYSIRDTSPAGVLASSNCFEFGGWNSVTECACKGVITPANAYNLDTKIDDGIANSGNIYGLDGDDQPTGACSYALFVTPAGVPTYNVSNNSPACRLIAPSSFGFINQH